MFSSKIYPFSYTKNKSKEFYCRCYVFKNVFKHICTKRVTVKTKILLNYLESQIRDSAQELQGQPKI